MSSRPAIYNLPENCISHILSFTTPRDLCICCRVSPLFRSAADSDYVWEKMLPPDYREIISRAITPVELSSKKELYFRLCSSILVDSGRKAFSIEKSSGLKCYMVSARELEIIWGDDSRYWRWISLPESRFFDVAELRAVCWLDIKGRFDVKMLSPKTWYVAHLVLKNMDNTYGFNSQPVELSLSFEGRRTTRIAFLGPDSPVRHLDLSNLLPLRRRSLRSMVEDNVPHRQAENVGWIEVEIGEFFSGEGDGGEVEMSLMETKSLWWKGGIVIEGIEIRPKKQH